MNPERQVQLAAGSVATAFREAKRGGAAGLYRACGQSI